MNLKITSGVATPAKLFGASREKPGLTVITTNQKQRMEINRETWPVISQSDFRDFIRKLKPMEADALWDAMRDSEQFELRFERFDIIRLRLEEMDSRIKDLSDTHSELSYMCDEMIKDIRNEK